MLDISIFIDYFISLIKTLEKKAWPDSKFQAIFFAETGGIFIAETGGVFLPKPAEQFKFTKLNPLGG